MVEQVKTKTEPRVRFRGFDDEWEEVKLGDYFTKYKETVYLDDDVEYNQITVKNTGEVVSRGSKFGGDIGRKRQYMINTKTYPNTLTFTRQSIYDGGIGFVPGELHGSIVTENMPLLSMSSSGDIGFMCAFFNTSRYYRNVIERNRPVGSAQKALHEKIWLKAKVRIPSLPEQQKIGELFETLDKAIDLSSTHVENLKQQKRALLQRLFPQKGETEPKVRLRGFTDAWAQVKLGDVAKLKNGYSFKSDLYTDNGSYKILTIGNITGDNYIDTTNTKTISKLPENIQGHQILSIGDILISMTGNVGRVSMVDVDGTLLNQRVGLIDISDTVDRTFLYQVLSNPLFEANMVDKGQGAAQMNIGKSDIESYSIYIPSLEEQQAIGELFQTLDEQIRLAEDKVSQYKELKQALLQRLFV